MATKKGKSVKIAYKDKLVQLVNNNKSAIIITIDNITSRHLQCIRKELRGRAQLIKGKNTYIRKILCDQSESDESLKLLAEAVSGNCVIIFTNENLAPICKDIKENKVLSMAKVGVVAPNDVVVPKGPTGFPPDMTTFFQTLNIPTKIVKGQIEITSDIDLIKEGNKVGGSEVELLGKLKIKPFLFGPHVRKVFDDGSVFSPEILEMDKTMLSSVLGNVSAVIGAIGLATGVPNTISVAHSARDAMKTLLAVAVTTDYSFKEAEELKERIANPDKFAVAAATETEEKAEETKEEEEEEVQDDFGGGMGDLFGDDEESE